MAYRILFTNLGYARGIDGRLRSHLRMARHYVHCPPEVQMAALERLRTLLHAQTIDLCCVAEIDAGSSNNHNFDQMHFLKDGHFTQGHAVNKYGREYDERITMSRGKSNGFLAREETAHRFRYLSFGNKRLICQLTLKDGAQIWFGHFSLRPWVRKKQFAELAGWLKEEPSEVLLLGDFNNYHGVGELRPLTKDGAVKLLNPPDKTFRLGGYRAQVDLALATTELAGRCRVSVIAQDFSDHDALLVEMR